MRFVDEVTFEIAAGDGGNGLVAFRRERRNPRGGPCGGDGGRGGDVVFRADRNLGTLLDLKSQPKVRAKRGQDGQGNDCHGRGAPAAVIRVPEGTLVIDDDTGVELGDLVEHGQEVIGAKGGKGGLGNMHFATSSNRAPRRAEPGEPGEFRRIRLELKLLADVGLVGLPNAGKSTLIAALSSARPKIADYPFTTLVPNLGVVRIDAERSFVMADIPGLIRGAAEGAGLGSQFLKHIQRTATLLYILSPDEEGTNDLLKDYDDLRGEVERFDPALGERPAVVALNKVDLPVCQKAADDLRRRLEERGEELTVISAATHQGLEGLKARLVRCMDREARSEESPSEAPPES